MNDFERKGNQHRVKTYAIVHVLRVAGKESLSGTANPLFCGAKRHRRLSQAFDAA